MIDYHAHLLPGLDDGAPDLETALEMARLLVGAGFTRIHCTPHCIRGLYPNTPQQVRRATQELQQQLDRHQLPLQLSAGMEYFLDEFFLDSLADPLPLGTSNLLLFEISPRSDPQRLKDAVFQVQRRGLVPLLAHPERYPALTHQGGAPAGFFQRLKGRLSGPGAAAPAAATLLDELLAMGCRLQGNLGTFTGFYGPVVAAAGRHLLAAGRYHHFGSDAHSPKQLRHALAALDDNAVRTACAGSGR